MKIKVGRRYLTRDGRVAFVCNKRPSTMDFCNAVYFDVAVTGEEETFTVTNDGKRIGHKRDWDLVAPYKPKKREPKVGDRVLTINGGASAIGEVRETTGDLFWMWADQGVGFEIGLHQFHNRQIVRFLNKEKV